MIPVVIAVYKSVLRMKIGCFGGCCAKDSSITCEGCHKMSFCSHISSLLCQKMQFSCILFFILYVLLY